MISPPGVDLSVFDGAVNSGPARSARWLQCAVGAGRDGVIGPKTLMKAEAMQPVSIIHEICNTRLAFLKSQLATGLFLEKGGAKESNLSVLMQFIWRLAVILI